MKREYRDEQRTTESGPGLANILASIFLVAFLAAIISLIYFGNLRKEAHAPIPSPTPVVTPTPLPTDPPIDPEEWKEAVEELYRRNEDLSRREKELENTMRELHEWTGIRERVMNELALALSAAGVPWEVHPLTGSIRFPGALLFGVGENVLNRDDQAFLREFVPIFFGIILSEKNRPFIEEIIIEGHADAIGTFENNLVLSYRRAMSVANFLFLENLHLLPGGESAESYLTVSGRSSARLILVNGTVDQVASRRVEFRFTLKDEEFLRRMQETLQRER